MKAIFTADLHLTARPGDDYRWTIWEWLRRQLSNRDCSHLFILGDLTDRTDNHPSVLVNRLTEELVKTTKICPVIILKGNHDYVEQYNPFFKFLNHFSASVQFIYKPTELKIDGIKILAIPHMKDFKPVPVQYPFKNYDRILFHQCVGGAKSPGGYQFEGMRYFEYFNYDKINANGHILAGDIHMPQRIRRVTYCGSPHPIDFGDDYDCRVLLEKENQIYSISRVTFRKKVVRITDVEQLYECDIRQGDWVKVIMVLPRSDFHRWEDIKANVTARMEALEAQLFGPELQEQHQDSATGASSDATTRKDYTRVIEDFGKAKGLDPDLIEFGKTLVETDQ